MPLRCRPERQRRPPAKKPVGFWAEPGKQERDLRARRNLPTNSPLIAADPAPNRLVISPASRNPWARRHVPNRQQTVTPQRSVVPGPRVAAGGPSWRNPKHDLRCSQMRSCWRCARETVPCSEPMCGSSSCPERAEAKEFLDGTQRWSRVEEVRHSSATTAKPLGNTHAGAKEMTTLSK